MKRLANKLKNISKRNQEPLPMRITSDTVAEHRERILAGGRRFKYPVQYARHKLVINATLISLGALLMLFVIGWWQLYPAQNTSEFMYRITKVVPLPVANIDGQSVPYSDYLMRYISSIYYLKQKEAFDSSSNEGQNQIKYYKQQSLKEAIADAYANKLARKLGISVSDSELEAFVKSQRLVNGSYVSEKTFNATILQFYGWSPSEYRYITKKELLRQKVAFAIDNSALTAIGKVSRSVSDDSNVNFNDLAKSVSAVTGLKLSSGSSGLVPKNNDDGGLALQASKLKKGQTSGIIKSSADDDGYYVIRVTDITSDKLSYDYVQVPLTKFNNDLQKIESSSKLAVHIGVSIKN